MIIEFAGITYPKQLWSLPTAPLASRLADFKAKKPKYSGGYYQDKPCPNTDGKMFYLDSDFMPGLRWSYCDEVEGARIDHTGWFTDEYGDTDKIRGIVMRLPHNRGFLAAWTMGTGMIGELDYDTYEDEVSAAFAADRKAERVADDERERNNEFDLEVA